MKFVGPVSIAGLVELVVLVVFPDVGVVWLVLFPVGVVWLVLLVVFPDVGVVWLLVLLS